MQKKKFYQKKWFMWLWLIILPPVGIVLMWLTQKEMKKKTKIIFTIVFLLWFLLLRSAMNSGSSTTENDNSEATQESSAVTDTVLTENDIETNKVENVEHRSGMCGISDKDVNSLDTKFTVSDVRNDVTGKWKISVIAENIDIEEYALSYYQTYFTDDEQTHAIVNFNRNTTTRISCMGDMLDVAIFEYVDKEEHDAKALFSGMLLKEYFIYIDNGDIEDINNIGNNSAIDEANNSEANDTEITSEDFVSDVKEAIKGDVGKDEEIVDVTFGNGNLCVYVDFSKMDPSPLTKEDVALARTSSITDDILTLTQYESLWDTITVDFGEVGHITNGKDDLQVGATGKYFDAVNFVIEQ